MVTINSELNALNRRCDPQTQFTNNAQKYDLCCVKYQQRGDK